MRDVVVGSSVPREYTGAAFGFANMAILAVGGLFFQPLIGILARMRGLVVPDANALSILIWAQAIGLLLLLRWAGARGKNHRPRI